LYEFKSRTKVTDFKALSNTSFLDAYILLNVFLGRIIDEKGKETLIH